jgi:hypothetical protein
MGCCLARGIGVERLRDPPIANLLAAHAFNFCSDSGKLHGPNLIDLIRTKREHICKP